MGTECLHTIGEPVKAHSAFIRGAVQQRPHLRGEVTLPRLAAERGLQMVRLYRNWPAAIRDRLGLMRAAHVLYRLRAGGGTVELVARANGCDVRTISEIWIGGFYDRLIDLDNLRNHAPVVIDIGANCGYFAIYMASRYPGCQLVCFEPEATNRTLAQVNLALNGVNATLHPEAVLADNSPTVTFYLSQDPRLHTTVALEQAGQHGISSDRYNGSKVTVPAVEINEVIAGITTRSRIDLLKVDVEGIDLDLLMAIDDQLLKRVDCIVTEIEGRGTAQVRQKLRSAGFAVSEDAGLLFASRIGQAAMTPARTGPTSD